MEKKFNEVHIYRPIMAGTMAGIIASVLNIFFDVVFRGATGFSLSAIINIATIIFATMLVLALAGVIYALIDKFTKYAGIVFMLLFILLTFLGCLLALHVHRSDNPVQSEQFRDLLLGIVIISGVSASFLIPYFTIKNNPFI
jgi:hypothetical protein